jgi:hypothetical protein
MASFRAGWAGSRPPPPPAGAGPDVVDADAVAGDTGELYARTYASNLDLFPQQSIAEMTGVRAAFMDGGTIDWKR